MKFFTPISKINRLCLNAMKVIHKNKPSSVFTVLLTPFLFFSLIIFPLPIPNSIFAQIMSSPSYKIPTDTINIGGNLAGSSGYILKDTLGEVGTGDSNSATYYMHAGFWQMQESYIALSQPSDLALSNINGLSGGGSEGTITYTVTTDNIAGYSMTINSNTTPAMKSSVDSFADYTPTGADPDYNFTNLPANSSFGFSPEGTDIISRFKDNGSACNTGTSDTTSKCWDGLSTSPKNIVQKNTGNHPTGTSTNIRFRAESGANHIQTSGNYSASITVTAIAL